MEKIIDGAAAAATSGLGLWSIAMSGIAALLTYLGLNIEHIAILTALMAGDLITGLAASFVMHERLKGRIFLGGFLTKGVMLTIPLTVAAVAKVSTVDINYMSGWVLSILVIYEATSILNNYQKARGNPPLPEIDIIGVVAKRLRTVLVKIIGASEATKNDK